MSVKIINEKEFKELISREELVIIDFFAVTCGPCRVLAPLLDELSSQVTIGKLDVFSYTDIANEYVIQGLPTLIFFKNGQIVESLVGLQTKTSLEAKIKQHK